MSVIEVFCRACNAVHPHAADDGVIVCTGCGLVLRVDADVLAFVLTAAEQPVLDMRFCPYCRETKPVGHDCPAGVVGCENNPPDGPTCGACQPCYRAQAQHLAVQDDYRRYGSQPDIDIP